MSRRIRSALALVAVVALATTGAVLTHDDDDPASPPAPVARPGSGPVVAPVLRSEGRNRPVAATFGVASANSYRFLDLEDATADWDRLTSRPGLDLIGWQESKSAEFRELYPQYRKRGWDTWFWSDPHTGPISLAFSWRTATFDLVDVETQRMHKGGYPRETTHPFPARWLVKATLRHRDTGGTVVLLNTHVNYHIETGQGFEDNLNARRAKTHLKKLAGVFAETAADQSMTVIGTGDYNFDYADDSAARPAGGITDRFDGVATSSYAALGLDGVAPTLRSRWIDYVFLADASAERAQFAQHRSLPGGRSDHSPLVARIRLYENAE